MSFYYHMIHRVPQGTYLPLDHYTTFTSDIDDPHDAATQIAGEVMEYLVQTLTMTFEEVR